MDYEYCEEKGYKRQILKMQKLNSSWVKAENLKKAAKMLICTTQRLWNQEGTRASELLVWKLDLPQCMSWDIVAMIKKRWWWWRPGGIFRWTSGPWRESSYTRFSVFRLAFRRISDFVWFWVGRCVVEKINNLKDLKNGKKSWNR